jgi:hypothetical protein
MLKGIHWQRPEEGGTAHSVRNFVERSLFYEFAARKQADARFSFDIFSRSRT